MRVLISGGTGFIGRELSRVTQRRGWEVTVLTRNPDSPSARALSTKGIQFVLGDVTKRNTVSSALEVTKPDLVFHNAGWYELGVTRRKRRKMWSVNVEGTENLLSLAAEFGVGKVVYTSSTTALGDTQGVIVDEAFRRETPPRSYYEQTKFEAHQIALQHQSAGEPVVIGCPAQVTGTGDHSPFGQFARLLVRGKLPPVAWGPESTFTFAHVEDVAESLARLGEKGRWGHMYFIAGEAISMRQLAAIWEAFRGRRWPWIWLPKPLAIGQGALLQEVLRLLGQPAFLSVEAMSSSFVSFQYSSEKAIQELGVVFRSAEQTWRETLEGERERWMATLEKGASIL
jgi:nucleoside-diphosphate-sugar epimerase